MVSRGTQSVATALVVVTTVPGVATAQPLDPAVVADAHPLVRAIVAFVVVAACSGLVLGLRGSLVDRAVDDTMENPAVAVVYGLGAFVFVVFATLYANNVLLQLGLVGTLGFVAAAVLLGGVALLGGLGYVVVGTLLTDVFGTRRPRQGLVVGSAISAVCWFALPALVAFLAWVLVAAFGVGGPTRTWFHGERSVRTERPTRE
jgi:MFS family permease